MESNFLHFIAWVLGYVTLGNYLKLSAYLAVSTFTLFVLIMGFKRVEDKLPPDLRYVGMGLLIVGKVHNCAFNTLVCTLLFLDIPRGFTTTGRLNRYWRDGHPGWRNWRMRLALQIRHRLDPFDPRGLHS